MLANRLKTAYKRDTELRLLCSNDLRRLAEILGLEGGRKLMQIIPNLGSNTTDNQVAAIVPERKFRYGPDEIRAIEDASQNKPYHFFPEMLILEWGTHGRKYERPTLGLLLQLLIKADLWHAAQFVTELLLYESSPMQPQTRPATRFRVSCEGLADFAEEGIHFADTTTLDSSADSMTYSELNNNDYFEKLLHLANCDYDGNDGVNEENSEGLNKTI